MDTSESFIRKIKIKYSQEGKQPTDYRLSKLLGMSPQGIHSFNTRGSVFDDKAGLQIAKLLNLDPAYVLMCLGAERTKDESAKKTYERIAKVFQYAASTAAAFLLAAVLFSSGNLSDNLWANQILANATTVQSLLCQILILLFLMALHRFNGKKILTISEVAHR